MSTKPCTYIPLEVLVAIFATSATINFASITEAATKQDRNAAMDTRQCQWHVRRHVCGHGTHHDFRTCQVRGIIVTSTFTRMMEATRKHNGSCHVHGTRLPSHAISVTCTCTRITEAQRKQNGSKTEANNKKHPARPNCFLWLIYSIT